MLRRVIGFLRQVVRGDYWTTTLVLGVAAVILGVIGGIPIAWILGLLLTALAAWKVRRRGRRG